MMRFGKLRDDWSAVLQGSGIRKSRDFDPAGAITQQVVARPESSRRSADTHGGSLEVPHLH